MQFVGLCRRAPGFSDLVVVLKFNAAAYVTRVIFDDKEHAMTNVRNVRKPRVLFLEFWWKFNEGVTSRFLEKCSERASHLSRARLYRAPGPETAFMKIDFRLKYQE
jgi:hypothetical protein